MKYTKIFLLSCSLLALGKSFAGNDTKRGQGGAVELRMPMWNGAGTAEIVVLVQGQPLKHPSITFSYFAEPTLSSITPTAGPSYQCTKVVIKGDNFFQTKATRAAGGEEVHCLFM